MAMSRKSLLVLSLLLCGLLPLWSGLAFNIGIPRRGGGRWGGGVARASEMSVPLLTIVACSFRPLVPYSVRFVVDGLRFVPANGEPNCRPLGRNGLRWPPIEAKCRDRCALCWCPKYGAEQRAAPSFSVVCFSTPNTSLCIGQSGDGSLSLLMILGALYQRRGSPRSPENVRGALSRGIAFRLVTDLCPAHSLAVRAGGTEGRGHGGCVIGCIIRTAEPHVETHIRPIH